MVCVCVWTSAKPEQKTTEIMKNYLFYIMYLPPCSICNSTISDEQNKQNIKRYA